MLRRGVKTFFEMALRFCPGTLTAFSRFKRYEVAHHKGNIQPKEVFPYTEEQFGCCGTGLILIDKSGRRYFPRRINLRDWLF
jgi:hypothetical protein